jgi:hypothetical protein
MARHDAAHRLHISAQAAIRVSFSLIAPQSRAQRSQTSAHAAHVWTCKSDPRSMKLALVWQISAQSIISRMWFDSA